MQLMAKKAVCLVGILAYLSGPVSAFADVCEFKDQKLDTAAKRWKDVYSKLSVRSTSNDNIGELAILKPSQNGTHKFLIKGAAKEEDYNKIGSLDTLGGATIIGYEYVAYGFSDDATTELRDTRIGLCKEHDEAVLKLCKANEECKNNDPNTQACKDVSDKYANIPRACDAYIKKKDRNTYKKIRNAEDKFAKSNLFYKGIKLLVGDKKHEYFDTTAMKEESNSRGATSGSIFLGHIFGNDIRLEYGITYQDFYKDGKATNVCYPNPTTPTIQNCKTLSLTAPTHKYSKVAYIEYADKFGISDKLHYKATYSHNLDDSTNGLSIPIYYAPKDPKDLTGGIQLDWVSKSDSSPDGSFTTSIFISKSFDVFR